MKVLVKSNMPDGTDIQIEDWKADYPGVFTLYTIAAYPKAKSTGRYKWVERGERFRLELSRGFSSDAEVELVFNGLESGAITLEELSSHYYNGDKDKYYMGVGDVETEPVW